MPEPIDLNRGVMIKRHTASGMYVYMYRKQPGIYYDAHGNEVSEAMAAAVGYDVATLAKARMKRERMAAAMSAIEAEIEAADGEDLDDKPLVERAGYKITKLPLGNANIYGPDGEKLNTKPMPVAEAKVMLDHLAPKEAKASKAAA